DRPAAGASVAGAGVAGAGAAGGARDPVFGGFFETQLTREEARRDREALGRLLAQAGDSGLSPEALSVVGSVQQNPELSEALKELTDKQALLRTYRYKYSDEYPPVKNTAPRVILMAFFGSFALAVMGAVLIDRIDPRVRYPDQVSREMGLTILGAVPHVRPGARPTPRNGRRVRPPEDVAVVVEALRG